MNRDAAIEAALQALAEDGVLIEADEIRTLVAAVIDAAAPHLVGEPVGYVAVTAPTVDAETVPYYRTAEEAAQHGLAVLALVLVPVEDQP